MFLSYARSSEEQATCVERTLRDAGYSVWRDTDLPAHLSYADVIEERLKSAKAVLVLWSAEAAKSQWVRAEADAARELGTLVQSSVDGTVPPIPFNQIQCADLTGWSGEDNHSGWRKLKSSIVALAGQAEERVKSPKLQRPRSSICVLPFQNLSGEEVPDYFSDGLSEDITSDLAKVRALSVVPRKTAFRFKGPDVDASSVAEELGVSYVLEGSVRRAGNRVRITAQLIEGDTGEYAWSDRYYRDFADIFTIQDEISQAVVASLKAKLLPAEKKPAESTETSGDANGAQIPAVPQEVRSDEAHSEFRFDPPNGASPEQELQVQDAQVAAPAANLDEHYAEAESYPLEERNSGQEWNADEDWDSEDDWRRKSFLSLKLPPFLMVGIAFVLVLVGAFVFWPDQPEPVVEQEKLAYRITSNVYVRSLPTLKGSRILGKLEPGDTINIVPTLAGAQPDWLKIKDGPYIGGYVWRESTAPVLDDSETHDSNSVTNTT